MRDTFVISSTRKALLVIHGGAGTLRKIDMSSEKEQEFISTLQKSLVAGYSALMGGLGAAEAVVAAIEVMEDSPIFNAGKGSVFTHEGTIEMDASIMSSGNQIAGAVAGVHHVRNPIRLAKEVMHHSPHVMLLGEGAEQFARERNLCLESTEYFRTPHRWAALEAIRSSEKIELDHDSSANTGERLQTAQVTVDHSPELLPGANDSKYGTVGCVALDDKGNLCAGTSTGGMTNKRWGRVGDTPIIGAGTWCNENVGVSCTGWGEFFIRSACAHDVACRMEYGGMGLATASEAAVRKMASLGGDGGLVALSKDGIMAMTFNTEGMYRGVVWEDGTTDVAIYRE